MGPFSEQVEGGIGPSALPIQFAGARRGETSCPRFALFLQSMVCTPSLQSADKAYAAPLPFFCKCAHNGFVMLFGPARNRRRPHRFAREKGSRFRRSACHAVAHAPAAQGVASGTRRTRVPAWAYHVQWKGRVAAVDFALYPCSREGERIQGGGL